MKIIIWTMVIISENLPHKFVIFPFCHSICGTQTHFLKSQSIFFLSHFSFPATTRRTKSIAQNNNNWNINHSIPSAFKFPFFKNALTISSPISTFFYFVLFSLVINHPSCGLLIPTYRAPDCVGFNGGLLHTLHAQNWRCSPWFHNLIWVLPKHIKSPCNTPETMPQHGTHQYKIWRSTKFPSITCTALYTSI